jgi:hypothetical protein
LEKIGDICRKKLCSCPWLERLFLQIKLFSKECPASENPVTRICHFYIGKPHSGFPPGVKLMRKDQKRNPFFQGPSYHRRDYKSVTDGDSSPNTSHVLEAGLSDDYYLAGKES